MPIHQLLVANHVTAVFHGHDHLFVKQELDGIIYQEVPQPSAARANATDSAAEYGYVQRRFLGSPGHLRVTVSPDRSPWIMCGLICRRMKSPISKMDRWITPTLITPVTSLNARI